MKDQEEKALFFVDIWQIYSFSRNALVKAFKEKEIDLTIDLYVILHLLATKQALTQQDLSDVSNKDKTIILRQVKTLMGIGCVVRIKDSIDGRKKIVVLTPRGQEIYEKAKNASNKLSESIFQKIDIKDKQFCKLIFQKLVITKK